MNITDLPVKAEFDYPKINNLNGNEKDIALLSKAYSSCGSETTAILQYIFQHYVFQDKDVADVLIKIAINEMKHHELLAETIVAIGGTPYYTNGFGGDFSTKCVYEGKDMLLALEQNIKDEQAGVEYYEEIKKQLSNPSLVKIIDRIILDELVHIDTFNKLIEYLTFYK